MNEQVRQMKILFANELHRCCAEKYNKFPSNEKLARDLCLASKYHLKVSRETVRKWLKGDTFPDLDCLLYLIEWLELDVAKIFSDIRAATPAQMSHSNTNNLNYGAVDNISLTEIDSVIQFLISLKKSSEKKYKPKN
jgi:hypothetical protein